MKWFTDTRTDEQKSALRLAAICGLVRDIAISRGGTGHLRKELTDKQAQKLLKRKRNAKQARKVNR